MVTNSSGSAQRKSPIAAPVTCASGDCHGLRHPGFGEVAPNPRGLELSTGHTSRGSGDPRITRQAEELEYARPVRILAWLNAVGRERGGVYANGSPRIRAALS